MCTEKVPRLRFVRNIYFWHIVEKRNINYFIIVYYLMIVENVELYLSRDQAATSVESVSFRDRVSLRRQSEASCLTCRTQCNRSRPCSAISCEPRASRSLSRGSRLPIRIARSERLARFGEESRTPSLASFALYTNAKMPRPPAALCYIEKK